MKKLLLALSGILTLQASAQNDGSIVAVYPADYMMPGKTKFSVTAAFASTNNSGKAYTINWSVDNGPVKTWASDPQNLYDYITAIGRKRISKDSFLVDMATPGTHVFKVWLKVTNPMDTNPANDTFTRSVKVMSYLPPKEVVLETYKHEQCGPCYPAANFLRDAMEQKQEFAIVNLYTAVQDQIYNADAHEVNTAYQLAHPGALFDRFKLPGHLNIYSNYVGGNTVVLDDTSERIKFLEPMEVKFQNVQYDVSSRLLKVMVKAKAYDTLDGEYRFNVYLTEDSVKAYQAGAPYPNNYYHMHVLRQMMGGPWGKAGSLTSTSLIKGQEYTYEFQATLPANWKTEKMHLVGMVQKYNAGDIMDRRMLNSCHANFNKALTLGVAQAGIVAPVLSIYPNPATEVVTIAAQDLDGRVTVVNSVGQIMKMMTVAHQQEVHIHTSEWAAGVYTVMYNNGASTNTYKVVVMK